MISTRISQSALQTKRLQNITTHVTQTSSLSKEILLRTQT